METPRHDHKPAPRPMMHNHHHVPGPQCNDYLPRFAVTINLTALKYDIKFETWMREEATRDDNPARNIAYKRDEAEDWLVEQIETVIDNVYGELAWCTDEADVDLTDAIPEGKEEWSVVFKMPKEWRGSKRHIKRLIHKYAVAYVKGAWYTNQSMPEGDAFNAEAERLLEELYYECRSDNSDYLDNKFIL